MGLGGSAGDGPFNQGAAARKKSERRELALTSLAPLFFPRSSSSSKRPPQRPSAFPAATTQRIAHAPAFPPRACGCRGEKEGGRGESVAAPRRRRVSRLFFRCRQLAMPPPPRATSPAWPGAARTPLCSLAGSAQRPDRPRSPPHSHLADALPPSPSPPTTRKTPRAPFLPRRSRVHPSPLSPRPPLACTMFKRIFGQGSGGGVGGGGNSTTKTVDAIQKLGEVRMREGEGGFWFGGGKGGRPRGGGRAPSHRRGGRGGERTGCRCLWSGCGPEGRAGGRASARAPRTLALSPPPGMQGGGRGSPSSISLPPHTSAPPFFILARPRSSSSSGGPCWRRRSWPSWRRPRSRPS